MLKKTASRRQDRQRMRTRAALLNAGEHLFATRPVEGVTIDDIVEAADVAKGSFYNHFDDKESLAQAIIELVQGDCEFHVFAANRNVTDPASRMMRAHCTMIAYAMSHPSSLQALLSLSGRQNSSSELNWGVTADLREGIEQKRFQDITIETGLVLVLGINRMAIANAFVSKAANPSPEYSVMIGSALLRALGVENGEATRIATESVAELLRVGYPQIARERSTLRED